MSPELAKVSPPARACALLPLRRLSVFHPVLSKSTKRERERETHTHTHTDKRGEQRGNAVQFREQAFTELCSLKGTLAVKQFGNSVFFLGTPAVISSSDPIFPVFFFFLGVFFGKINFIPFFHFLRCQKLSLTNFFHLVKVPTRYLPTRYLKAQASPNFFQPSRYLKVQPHEIL